MPARALGSLPLVGPRLRAAYHRRRKRRGSAENVTRRNTRRAYERLYRSDALLADYRSPARMRFYEEVAEHAAALRPTRVLDVGCGSGDLLAALARRLPGPATLVGVDHASAAVERARETIPEGRFVVADLFSLGESGAGALGGERFDLVLCTEVLEHLERADAALAVLAGLRAEGGALLVTVPDGDLDDWAGHVNFWDSEELARRLEPAGRVRVERLRDGVTLVGLAEAQA